VQRRSVVSLIAALSFAVSAFAATAPTPLVRRLAVLSFYNPRLMYLKYQPLVDYLSATTGETWELLITPSYDNTIEVLCTGQVDLAYLAPYTYLRAHDTCGVVPLVRLNTGGKATYRSLILVKSDSSVRRLRDLAGKRFAFGSPMSTSSHLVPRAMLGDAGLRPGVDYSCLYFLHHERAVRILLLGEADACGVRDIVGEKFTPQPLRVLARSEEIPNFPLVLAPGSPPELRDTLLRVLVVLPRREPKLAERISHFDQELAGGFAPCADRDYLPIRRLALRLFGPGAFVLPTAALECNPGGP
jgi:phosphonate transport system substrate-binding protein